MKRWGLVLAVLACVLLTSCGLLPAEETFQTAPLLREYEREEFKLALVERGDLELSQKVSCTFMPVRTEILRYEIGGIYYDENFVEVGDSVEAGQLLAQLELGDVEERIKSCEVQAEKLSMSLTALEENRALALARQRISMQGGDSQDLREALREVNKQYDAQKAALEEQALLNNMRLEEYEKELSDRQLRASFAGTITYIRNIKDGDRSVADERFITIADSTMSLFRAETQYWNVFEPGTEFIIMVGKEEYEAIVATEEELGLEAQEKEEGKKAYVYLKLKNPTFDLEDGARGNITIVLDSRTDVLKIPASAVSSANGEEIVYYQNEAGMKAYKPIVTGMQAGDMIEVISGLTEGESIIVK